MSRRLLATAALLAAAALPARAQQVIGHAPERSPYRDVEGSQTVTILTGWWAAGTDPAGVQPQSAPFVGVRYDWTIGSAGSIYVRGLTALSKRDPIEPARAPGQRALGTRRWPITSTDVGFNLQLTGRKSLYGIVPSVSGGLGFLTDFVLGQDVGGYEFGTTFAFTFGGGVRYVLRDRTHLRLEVHDILHRYRYPDSYFATTTGGPTPVLADGRRRGGWRHNFVLQLGAQLVTFR